MRLSAIDRKILNNIQKNFPVCIRPYRVIGERLGLTEDEVINKIKELNKSGVICRFGVSVNHKKLGYYSTLIAVKVSSEKIKETADEIITYPEVTHCFIREGEYNLWFVYITTKKQKIENLLKNLSRRLGKKNILNLVTKKKLKLETNLKL